MSRSTMSNSQEVEVDFYTDIAFINRMFWQNFGLWRVHGLKHIKKFCFVYKVEVLDSWTLSSREGDLVTVDDMAAW